MLLTYDDMVTTAQAAHLAKVKPGTIRQWKNRGLIAPAGLTGTGLPLYLVVDVAKAEYATRKRARRAA